MRNWSWIIYPEFGAGLHKALPRKWAVFQSAVTCFGTQVYWSVVLQYQPHTTETLNYLVDYIYQFHRKKDIFTAYMMSKFTDNNSQACPNNQKK